MKPLAVAIDGGRYVKWDASYIGERRKVRLQTLRPEQTEARIRFFRFTRRGTRRTKERHLTGLPGKGEAIEVHAEPRGWNRWSVQIIRPDGEVLFLVVPAASPLVPILVAAATTIAVIVAILFLLRPGRFFQPTRSDMVQNPRSTPAVPEEVSPASETVVDREEAAPATETAIDREEVSPATETAIDQEATSTSVEPIDKPTDESAVPVFASSQEPVLIVYFQPDSAEISTEALEALEEVARRLPQSARLDLSGHCAYFGTERGRVELSVLRAEAVGEILAQTGKIDSEAMKIVGHGMSRLVSRNPETQHLNRRVEIRLF